MLSAFDRRVVSEEVLDLVRACQRRVTCHLAGGAALAGAFLAHRLSRDIALFCHEAGGVRALSRELPSISTETGARIRLVQDSPAFVRAHVALGLQTLELDLVQETVPDIESPHGPIEGVVVESLADLRAAKLTCLLSRSEPRDLVDLLFLDRAGYPPEADLPLALRKDTGIDPAVLAWLLGEFPTAPLPVMLEPLSEAELRSYRDALRERMRRAALP